DPGAHAIMTLVVELAPEQLTVRAIHRLVRTASGETARAALATRFAVRPVAANDAAGVAALERAMVDEGALGLVDGQGCALLVPGPDVERAVGGLEPPLPGIDAARFDAGAVPVLGDADVTYRHDALAVAGIVRTGRANAGVLLRAVTVDDIAIAARG